MQGTSSWIVLTMGDRPLEVAAAVESIRTQSVPPDEILLVGNGAAPGTYPGVRSITLPENLGVTGGRNAGAAAATGDVLFFLDDDARCADDQVARAVVDLFEQRHDVAAVSMRITDETTGVTQRRHVPRLRAGNPLRSSDVTTFLGGACAIRRLDYEKAGGYPDAFFYSMEETDLAWRLLDAGRSIHYLATATVHHPATQPARHGQAFVSTARNRVWTAHRRLPRVVAAVYLLVWTTLMLLRAPGTQARRDVVRGLADGVRQTTPRPIDRMRWRTVARMTRLGRPPVI
ncbi:MAG: glycosyltransferase [Acidimicrobiales bacterium]